MNQQNAVDRGIRQRQQELIHQGGERGPRGGPFQHTLGGRHKGDAPLGIFTKKSQIGRRITDAEHALAIGVGPARPDAAIDQLPRHDPEALRIEVAQVNDVHDTYLTRPPRRPRAEYYVAAAALTPYL